jgi:hypothetical protein
MSHNNEQNFQLPSLAQGFTTPSPGVPSNMQQGQRMPNNMYNYPSAPEASRQPWQLAPLQPSQLLNRPANDVFSYHDVDKRMQMPASMPNMYNHWP